MHLKLFDAESYFEDMIGSGLYIAVASRRNRMHEHLVNELRIDSIVLDYGEFMAQAIRKKIEKESQAVTKSTTAPTTIEESQSSRSSVLSSNCFDLLFRIEDDIDIHVSKNEEIDVEEFDDIVEISYVSSAKVQHFDPDELDKDAQWNDEGNERITSEDFNDHIDDFEYPDAD